IPCAQPDSLLRYAADISGGDPDRIVHDMIEAATRGRFQLARLLGLPLNEWLFGLGRRLHEARMVAEGYLWLGHHTKHYVGPVNTGGGDLRSLLDWLVYSIACAVRACPRFRSISASTSAVSSVCVPARSLTCIVAPI